MYPKIFITFSYHDGYTICFANRIYSIDTPIRITEKMLEKAKTLFFKEKRYNSEPCDNICIIFWNQIYTESDAVDDRAAYKSI